MKKENYRKAIKSDKELVILLQSLSAQMQKTAYSFNPSESFISEVISETVYKVYKNRKKVRNSDYLVTWIISILMNECRQELRRLKMYQNLYNPDQIKHEGRNDYSYVHDYLDQLDYEEQELIRMKIFSGLTFTEISEHFSIPESTAKTRYYAILKKLKWEMEETL